MIRISYSRFVLGIHRGTPNSRTAGVHNCTQHQGWETVRLVKISGTPRLADIIAACWEQVPLSHLHVNNVVRRLEDPTNFHLLTLVRRQNKANSFRKIYVC